MQKKRILSIIMLAFILTGMIGISAMAEGVGFEEKKMLFLNGEII